MFFMFTPSGYKDLGIKKFGFVAKICYMLNMLSAQYVKALATK